MEILMIQELYEIGEILSISEPVTGSGDGIIITSTRGKYIYKQNQRLDFLDILIQANTEFRKSDVRMNNVICSVNGRLIEEQNSALFTYIEGESKNHLQGDDSRRALKYMVKLNDLLRNIDIKTINMEKLNYWDSSKSLVYITSTFYSDLLVRKDSRTKGIMLDAIQLLQNRFTELNELPIQVIHSDLGPEHFLFDACGDICGVIDFTPDIKSEFHSLAQYIYWNYLWKNCGIDMIEENLKFYISHANTDVSLELIWLIVLEVTVSRYVGRLLHLRNQADSLNDSSLDNRLEIVAMVKAKCI